MSWNPQIKAPDGLSGPLAEHAARSMRALILAEERHVRHLVRRFLFLEGHELHACCFDWSTGPNGTPVCDHLKAFTPYIEQVCIAHPWIGWHAKEVRWLRDVWLGESK